MKKSVVASAISFSLPSQSTRTFVSGVTRPRTTGPQISCHAHATGLHGESRRTPVTRPLSTGFRRWPRPLLPIDGGCARRRRELSTSTVFHQSLAPGGSEPRSLVRWCYAATPSSSLNSGDSSGRRLSGSQNLVVNATSSVSSWSASLPASPIACSHFFCSSSIACSWW